MNTVKAQCVRMRPRRRVYLANVMVRRVLTQARAHQPAEAIATTARMLAMEPLCAWAYFYRAGLRLATGDVAGALADFRALGPIGPGWMLLCRDLQIPPPALYPALADHLNEALESGSQLPWAHVFQAFYCHVTEQWSGASAAIDRALWLDPSNPTILAFSARLKYVSRLPKAGVQAMERALKLAPSCPWINAWMGEVNRYRGNHVQALRDLNRSIGSDPQYIIAYSWRGSVLRLLGMPRRALSDINFAIANELVGGDYSLAWAFHERSLLMRALGRFDEAFRDLKRAHSINQRYVWTGDLYRKDDPQLQSIALLDRIISRRPSSAWAYAWRGWTLAAEGRSEQALRDLDRAVRLRPALAWAWTWRAHLHWASGDADLAGRGANRALALDPRYAYSHMLQARLHQDAGRWARADTSLQQALTLDRVCASAWAQRGQVAFRRGRYAEADQYLTRAIGLDANFQEATQWRERVRAAAA
jgi:tetratricopeptide (TPR) repeat protein